MRFAQRHHGKLEGKATRLPHPSLYAFRELAKAAALNLKDCVVIIDDLPRIVPGGRLSSQLDVMVSRLKEGGCFLLLTSYFPLPATLEAILGSAAYTVKRFERHDVLDLLEASGAPEQLRTDKIAGLLVTVAEGLPTLVMAAVRYLKDHSWGFTLEELDSLLRGDFAQAHRLGL